MIKEGSGFATVSYVAMHNLNFSSNKSPVKRFVALQQSLTRSGHIALHQAYAAVAAKHASASALSERAI